ncbi:MAG TPA: twin-arginine translocase subunit TatC [Actinomycetota bacterium]|nr:twin-arginine translocase subunit TatC [Actinomycetota bacterium]
MPVPAAQTGMTILEHLEELRVRIIRMLIGLGVTAVVAWFLYNRILSFLTLPLSHLKHVAAVISRHHELLVTGPVDPLFIRIQVVIFAALALDLPVILWQTWRFVAPGLYAKEKRYAIPFVATAMALFAGGVALAIVTLPSALSLLTSFAGGQIQLLPTANEYLSFVTLLMIAFGVAFEFPLVLVALSLVRVVSSTRLRRWRRPAWVVILILAGFLTPGDDPITQLLLALPLAILYEVTIWVTRLLKR